MRKFLLLILFIICISSLFAQTTFRKIPFEQAQEIAKKEKRILLIQLYSKECGQCNEVVEKSLTEASSLEKISQENILAVKYFLGDPDWDQLTKLYKSPAGLALLFFSPTGKLIYRYDGANSGSDISLQLIDIAISKLNDEAEIEPLEKAYASGIKTPKLLASLIDYRQNLDWETGTILDEYVRSLPKDSMQSIPQIIKIAGYAPALMSYADSMMRSNNDIFKQSWNRMDLQIRIGLVNKIIAKSRKKAIELKNIELAYEVASYAAQVYNSTSEKNWAFNVQFMEFSRETNDTSEYLLFSEKIYDQHYMQFNVDSIKQLDSKTRESSFSSISNESFTDIPFLSSGRISIQKVLLSTTKAQYIGNELTRGAFTLYTMNPSDIYIKMALKWSARSLEYNISTNSLDTYARLLYKTGQRDSAIYYQQKAVELEKKKGYKAAGFETVLEKMKKKEARIDEYCCDYKSGK
jgi:hypothetical protein